MQENLQGIDGLTGDNEIQENNQGASFQSLFLGQLCADLVAQPGFYRGGSEAAEKQH